MGCCGRSNKESAKVAGYFGLVQGVVTLILDCFFLGIYFTNPARDLDEEFPSYLVLLYVAPFFTTGIQVLLVFSAMLNCMWIASSVTMLKANVMENGARIKQWVVVTGIILTADILVAGLLVGTTLMSFMSSVIRPEFIQKEIYESSGYDFDNRPAGSPLISYDTITWGLIIYYPIFCLTVTRCGPLLLIVNIVLNVFVNRRAKEVSSTGQSPSDSQKVKPLIQDWEQKFKA